MLNNSNTPVSSPIQLVGYNSWYQIASGSGGGDVFLGIQSNGTLWSWGANDFGQVGLNTTAPNVLSPNQIGSLSTWTQISINPSNALALQSNGSLWSWGYNFSGQLGNNIQTSTNLFYSPTQVGTSNTWTQIAAGQTHSMAIQSNGTLWGWGSRSNGENGEGFFITGPTSKFYTSVGEYAKISTSTNSFLFTKAFGYVVGAGNNSYGQLGSTSGPSLLYDASNFVVFGLPYGGTTPINTPVKVVTTANSSAFIVK